MTQAELGDRTPSELNPHFKLPPCHELKKHRPTQAPSNSADAWLLGALPDSFLCRRTVDQRKTRLVRRHHGTSPRRVDGTRTRRRRPGQDGLGGTATRAPARVAYLLEEFWRLRPADHDAVDLAGGRERWRDCLADSEENFAG